MSLKGKPHGSNRRAEQKFPTQVAPNVEILLTARERELMTHLALGLDDKTLKDLLGLVTVGNARKRRYDLMQRLITAGVMVRNHYCTACWVAYRNGFLTL